MKIKKKIPDDKMIARRMKKISTTELLSSIKTNDMAHM